MLRHVPMLLVLLALWAGAAAAQVPAVGVRSGEHPGFTRLAIDLGDTPDWAFGRTADGYAFRVARGGVRYDLSRVFRHIGRDRLSAIWADPDSGDLRLGIGCACHAVAFEARPGVVAIDIRDGPAVEGSGYERALAAPDGPAVAPPGSRPVRRPQPRPGGALVQAPVPAPPATALPRNGTAEQMAVPPPDPLPPPLPDPRAVLLRNALLDRIGAAATHGLVESVAPLPPDMVPNMTPNIGSDTGPPAAAHLHLRDGTHRPTPFTGEGGACLSDADVALADWGGDMPFTLRLADLRSKLLGEFDRPDPAVALALARLYLHAGFGAEAAETMAAFGNDTAATPVIAALAAVMDGRPPPGDHALSGMEGCDGAVALWAVLARPSLSPGDAVENAAVLRAFSALPLHLRRHLGPDLSRRFLELGDEGAAQAARDAVGRAPGEPGGPMRLAEARAGLARGETAAAEDALRTLATANDATAAEAMVALTESVIARGGMLDPGGFAALGALEREHRGGPAAAPLRRALALVTAASGDYAEGFALAVGAGDILPDLWRMLAERGGDDALLRHALADGPLPDLPAATRRALAGRLLDLGFPEAAEGWIPPPRGAQEDRLAARAALLRRDGRGVLRLLAGETGPEAAALRAEAHELLGRHGAAARAWQEAGEPGRAEHALWRAGEAGPEPVGPEPPEHPTGTDPAGPLAHGRLLLEASRETRITIDQLLDTFPMPADTAPTATPRAVEHLERNHP